MVILISLYDTIVHFYKSSFDEYTVLITSSTLVLQWVSSILLLFASLNHKAFGNFSVIHKRVFTPGPYDSNNRGYRSFFKLNNGIYKKFYV